MKRNSDNWFITEKCTCDSQACNVIKKETQGQVFSCEFCEISKNTFLYRTPLVVASETRSKEFQKNYVAWKILCMCNFSIFIEPILLIFTDNENFRENTSHIQTAILLRKYPVIGIFLGMLWNAFREICCRKLLRADFNSSKFS